MKFYKAFLYLNLAACLSLSSCYHEFPKGGGGGGGGNNNGNTVLNVFVTTTPTTTFSFSGITWQIANISLVNSAGTTITIANSSGSPFMTYPQLQTDSAYFGFETVAATSYTKLLVTLGPTLFSYVYNGSNATLFSAPNTCAPGLVCLIPSSIPGFGASPTPISVPITFTTTANTNTGIRVNFDFSKAVTTAGAQGMTFDFTQPGAITLIALPTASSQTSGIDTIDNFTGVVTATTATTVTVQSYSSEPHTFTLASSGVEFDDPFMICNPQPASSTCLHANQNVSIDGYVASDSSGTRTATEIEFLDPAPAVNELEGVIISPVVNNQFKIILTNGMGTPTTIVSSPMLVNLNIAPTLLVDPKNLGVLDSLTGFLNQSDLVMGQTVMLQGGTFSGNPTSITNPTRILLRYSTISGTVQAPGANIFTLANVSPFYTNLTGNNVQVLTFAGPTAYDNISNFAGLSNVTNVSVRGLYLNPNSGAIQPLLAAKIRSH